MVYVASVFKPCTLIHDRFDCFTDKRRKSFHLHRRIDQTFIGIGRSIRPHRSSLKLDQGVLDMCLSTHHPDLIHHGGVLMEYLAAASRDREPAAQLKHGQRRNATPTSRLTVPSMQRTSAGLRKPRAGVRQGSIANAGSKIGNPCSEWVRRSM